MLTVERKKEIKELADKTRIENHSGKLPPYNPVGIANNLGINVESVKFKTENISAALLISNVENKEGKKTEIYVRVADNPLRQNFSVAHELGHYFLHKKSFVDEPEYFWRITPEKQQEEAEANEFAANLLMPEDIFKKRWEETKSSPEELSDEFLVSVSAIIYRAKNLKLIP